MVHEGPARVFDCEEDAIAAIKGGKIVEGGRGRDPLRRTERRSGNERDAEPHIRHCRYGAGLLRRPDHRRTFQRRFQGASIGHVSPEAAVGGPIALIEEGDIISIDIPNLKLEVKVSDEEMQARKAKWQPRQPKVTTGYLARYAAMVTSGNRGAILEIPKAE